MIELPESITLAKQFNEHIKGKTIKNVIAGQSPHKFAFFFGEKEDYADFLIGETIGETKSFGGHVEVFMGDKRLNFNDGTILTYHENEKTLPKKHQLLLEFDDNTYLTVSVAMYGAILAFPDGMNDDNFYYTVQRERPSPLSKEFDEAYFDSLFSGAKPNLSAKAFLATEQRIPGLGNGVLHDILFNCGINPRTKLSDINDSLKEKMYSEVKNTLLEMTQKGGRNTEKDLLGNKGGYECILHSKMQGSPCPKCGGTIVKENYLGGSIYYCDECQSR